MDGHIRAEVRRRAQYFCEYCKMPESATPFVAFHAEHIVARQHRADDSIGNLALACDRCNAYKGPNLSSVDPETDDIVELFHPRQQQWDDHFRLSSGFVLGKTACGRATVKLLRMNAPRRVQLRLEALADG